MLFSLHNFKPLLQLQYSSYLPKEMGMGEPNVQAGRNAYTLSQGWVRQMLACRSSSLATLSPFSSTEELFILEFR